MIYFIKQNLNGFEITSDASETKIVSSDFSFFSDLLLLQFTTLEGRLNATKKLLSINKNIPLIINNETIFMVYPHRKNINRYYINLQAIYSIDKKSNDLEITYKSGEKYIIKSFKEFKRIQSARKKIQKIQPQLDKFFSKDNW